MKPVENTQEGAVLLEGMISDVLKEHHPFKYVIIGMESTGFYGVHLANYLSASDLLTPFSLRVYCLNPKEVKNYKAILQTVQGLNPEEYTVLNSIPEIGKGYSAGILAEISSVKAFKSADALALTSRKFIRLLDKSQLYSPKKSR